MVAASAPHRAKGTSAPSASFADISESFRVILSHSVSTARLHPTAAGEWPTVRILPRAVSFAPSAVIWLRCSADLGTFAPNRCHRSELPLRLKLRVRELAVTRCVETR